MCLSIYLAAHGYVNLNYSDKGLFYNEKQSTPN